MENENNFELSRETYRKIKSFDRHQMQQFITDVRNSSDTDPVDLDKLRNEIGQVKGIGASRLDEIMSVIERVLSENSVKSKKDGEPRPTVFCYFL